LNEPSVWMPHWFAVSDTAAMPRACSARPSIETAICSPEASSRSISRPRGDGRHSRAIAISWSVVLPIAETATTTCADRFSASPIRPATAMTFSGVATGAAAVLLDQDVVEQSGRGLRHAVTSAEAAVVPASNSLKRGPSGDRRRHAVGDHFRRLVAVAGDADDDRLVARDAALLDQLLRDRHRGAAGGSVKMPSVSASRWMPARISSS
jgi:hypothetical protein